MIHRPAWGIPERNVTPETVFDQRRRFLKAGALWGLSLTGGANFACGPSRDAAKIGAQENPPAPNRYPAPRNSRFQLDRPLTEEIYAASYNNFYEFSVFKGGIYKKAAQLKTAPWQIAVTGLVEKPKIFDIDELARALPLEERLYRFRCVEAWGMAVFRGQESRCAISSPQFGRCPPRSSCAS